MTPEQIDAVLPRVPAGIPAMTGDLIDDEERERAVMWLFSLYGAAERSGGTWGPPDPAERSGGAMAVDPWDRGTDENR